MGWLKVKAAAKHSGISERLFRDWLKRDLRHVRLPSGMILVKSDWIDSWLEHFVEKRNQIDDIVNQVTLELKRR
jgi:hypothetical protein